MEFIEKQINNNIILDIGDEPTVDSNTVASETNETINTESGATELTNNEFAELKKGKIKKNLLFTLNSRRPPSGSVIIVDNFYNNAMDTRNFILTQEFSVKGNYPGQRTISYANEHLKEIIQQYVEPFGGKITIFPCPQPDGSDATSIYNGAFQYTTSRDRSWVHNDSWNNWAGVVFLTPDAPLSSGTAFYRFCDGAMSQKDGEILKNKDQTDRYSQDLTKWELVDTVGNVFNRLILFDANRYHMSMDYFGDNKENGRLFQVFFFTTEK